MFPTPRVPARANVRARTGEFFAKNPMLAVVFSCFFSLFVENMRTAAVKISINGVTAEPSISAAARKNDMASLPMNVLIKYIPV